MVVPKIDVTDESIIDAEPSDVFKALLDEFEGAKNWWMPHWEAKPSGKVPFRQIGGVIYITVHRIGKPQWSAKSTEIIQNKLLKADFFEGDFLGSGEWNLEQLDGKTKVKFRFNVKTNKLLFTLVSPVVNIGNIHSDVMQKGFTALNSYLSKK
jgi:uncharacterized protein YndB with AHSA1/START domain